MPTAIKSKCFPPAFESLLLREFDITFSNHCNGYCFDNDLLSPISDSLLLGACLQILHDSVNFMLTSDPKTKKVTVYCTVIKKSLHYESMYEAVTNLCRLVWWPK